MPRLVTRNANAPSRKLLCASLRWPGVDLALRGKAAAVMAGSDGLGRASARALAREGARVAICGRREEHLRAAAKELSDESGSEVVPIVADVSRAADVTRFVDEAAARFGRLDVLVTNKGGPPHGRFADVTDADWTQSFELIVMSFVRAVRAALPHLRRAGGGAVVAIESSSVKQPIPNLLLSNALRPAVVGASKSLAAQYGPENIRFNVVLPGSMDTDRARDLARHRAEERGATLEEEMALRSTEIPLRRLGSPDELGALVAFLASPAAAYLTGTAVQVDGGMIRSVY